MTRESQKFIGLVKKSDFESMVSAKTGLSKKEVSKLMSDLADVLVQELNKGMRVRTHIGTFTKRIYKPQKTSKIFSTKKESLFISFYGSENVKAMLK